MLALPRNNREILRALQNDFEHARVGVRSCYSYYPPLNRVCRIKRASKGEAGF